MSFKNNPNTSLIGILGASEGGSFTNKYAICLNSDNNDNKYIWHQSTYSSDSLIWLDFTNPTMSENIEYEITPYPYDHWTLKEIMQQSVSLLNALNKRRIFIKHF